ncbi:Nitrate reductase molybdenum cofactor assembly chaperone NarJ [bacterium HR09]|nr:Nitrate reductase molybdenum cofactor assembly chaperone NarJ [bacterium HR09]
MSERLLQKAPELLAYPDKAWWPRVQQLVAELEGQWQKALAPWVEALQALAPEEREELYVRTFDFDPATTLEIGWHLFGEDYRRGEFLASCRRLLAEVGVPEQGQLPDHAGLLLAALPALPPPKAEAFFASFLHPGLEKISSALAQRENPYRYLLEALDCAAAALTARAAVMGGSL